MGIDARVKIRMLFLKERKAQALKVFRWLANVEDDGFFDISNDDWDGVGELSFQRVRLDGTGQKFSPYVYVVSLEQRNDRNFWVERWGLKRIVKNTADPAEDDTPPEPNYDWYDYYATFAAKLGCVAEIDTFVIDNLEKERFVVNNLGEEYFHEENKCVDLDKGKWSNPDYGKKKLEEIIAERYSEYALKTTVRGV